MQRRTALVSLLAGIAAFGLGTVTVTAALDPYVWPSLLVGLPVGVVLGVSTLLVTSVGVAYRDERRDAGTVSVRTRRRLWATLTAVVVGIVVGGAAVAALATQAIGLALALVVGLAVGVVAGVVAALLVWFVGREETTTENESAEKTNG